MINIDSHNLSSVEYKVNQEWMLTITILGEDLKGMKTSVCKENNKKVRRYRQSNSTNYEYYY